MAMWHYSSLACLLAYLATDLRIQTATPNLSRASETVGGWIGTKVRATERTAQDKLAFVDGVVGSHYILLLSLSLSLSKLPTTTT